MLLARGVNARIRCHGRIVAISPGQANLALFDSVGEI
jgi:hypothetical protein